MGACLHVAYNSATFHADRHTSLDNFGPDFTFKPQIGERSRKLVNTFGKSDFLTRIENDEKLRRMKLQEKWYHLYGPEAVMGDPEYSQKQFKQGRQMIQVPPSPLLLQSAGYSCSSNLMCSYLKKGPTSSRNTSRAWFLCFNDTCVLPAPSSCVPHFPPLPILRGNRPCWTCAATNKASLSLCRLREMTL